MKRGLCASWTLPVELWLPHRRANGRVFHRNAPLGQRGDPMPGRRTVCLSEAPAWGPRAADARTASKRLYPFASPATAIVAGSAFFAARAPSASATILACSTAWAPGYPSAGLARSGRPT